MEKTNIFNKTLRIFLVNSIFFLLISGVTLAQEQNKERLTYKNEELGIEITGPEGWHMSQLDNKTEVGIPVMFTRYPLSSKQEDDVRIILEIQPMTQECGKTPLEYANHYFRVLKDMMINVMGVNVKEVRVIKKPTLVKINNQEGANYVYEMKILTGNREKNFKSSEYIFTKGDLFYLLYLRGWEEYFDKHVKEFEEAVNTFVLK